MIPINTDNKIESALFSFSAQPEKEIYLIKETFAKTVKNHGPNQWNPFVVFFDTPFSTNLIVQSRPVIGYESILSSVSEIFCAYAPMNAHAAILVLDATVEDDFGDQVDALKLFFISEAACQCLTITYTVDDDNDVIYCSEDDYRIDPVTLDNFSEAYKDLYVIMFTYTHLESSPYTEQEAVSYLTSLGHYLHYLNESSHFPYLLFEPNI